MANAIWAGLGLIALLWPSHLAGPIDGAPLDFTFEAVATAAAAQPAPTPTLTIAPGETLLNVSAEGRSHRQPDLAVFSAGVVTQARTAGEALTANARRMDAVIAALKRSGVAERDIQTSTIALMPQYRYGENVPPVITGYQATTTVNVRFREVARAGSILDALVATGANQINGPELVIDQPRAAMDEARVDAMRIARDRAELYAKAAGLRVRRILAISESGELPGPVPVMLQRGRMAAADMAESKIAPGEQTVGVTLSVRFELE